MNEKVSVAQVSHFSQLIPIIPIFIYTSTFENNKMLSIVLHSKHNNENPM